MFKKLKVILFLFIFSSICYADTRTDQPGILIGDANGTNAGRYRSLKFSNGATTNNGDGSLTVTTSSGSGTVNTGAAGAFAYYPSAGTTVDDSSVVFTDGTNVGIGTSAPSARLNIVSTGTSSAAFSIKVGTSTLALTNAGSLGIGTTAPASILNAINGFSDFRFSLGALNLTPTISAINTDSPGKAIGLVAGVNGTALSFDSAGFFSIQSESKSNFLNNSVGQGAVLMKMSNMGNFGLGVTDDTLNDYLFNVRTDTDNNIGFRSNAGSIQFVSHDNPDLAYKPLKIDSSALYLNGVSGGNVGIGTTAPSEKLSVSGNELVTGNISSPGSGTPSSEKFGAFAIASGDYSTALGDSSTASGSLSMAIGQGSSATSIYGLAIGQQASTTNGITIGNNSTSSNNGLVFGIGSSATGSYSLAFGNGGANAAYLASIAFGANTVTTATHQFVVGSPFAYIDNMFLGSGVVDTSPVGFTLNGTGGSGSNVVGGNLTLAAGKATGNAAGGSLIFSTSVAGSTGSTLQSLSERMRINSSGNVGIGTTSPQSLLHVQGVEATNGSLTLSADDSDDAGDSWSLISTASGNALQITNDKSGHVPLYIDADGNVGIGISAPSTLFDIKQTTDNADASFAVIADRGDDASDTWQFKSAASTNNFVFVNASNTVASITPNGHWIHNGITDPTVGSGATDCGTSPAIAGSDTAGKVTVGSSTNGGKCTVTFGVAWATAPVCVVNDQSTAVLTRAANVTTSAFELTGVVLAGDVLTYICMQYN